MNCEQFENRVQQLLDERSNLSFDIQLQNHSRDCDDCRAALNVYQSFSPMRDSIDECLSSGREESAIPSILSMPAILPKVEIARKARQRRLPISLSWIVASAALILVSLFLIPEQRTTSPVAMLDSVSDVTSVSTVASSPNADIQMDAGMSVANASPWYQVDIDFAGILHSTVPAGLGGITSVDLTSLGRLDLVAWIPNEPVRVVRSIPATIESIEPYYRYSSDLPMLNRWSSGINCTIGLIQSSLTYSGSDDPNSDRIKDFGHVMPTDLRNLC